MEGMADLPEEQKQQLLQKIEEMQVRDRSVICCIIDAWSIQVRIFVNVRFCQ